MFHCSKNPLWTYQKVRSFFKVLGINNFGQSKKKVHLKVDLALASIYIAFENCDNFSICAKRVYHQSCIQGAVSSVHPM